MRKGHTRLCSFEAPMSMWRKIVNTQIGCVLFTCDWGLFAYGSSCLLTVGELQVKKHPISGRGRTVSTKRPNQISAVSKKPKPNYRKQQRPTESKNKPSCKSKCLPKSQSSHENHGLCSTCHLFSWGLSKMEARRPLKLSASLVSMPETVSPKSPQEDQWKSAWSKRAYPCRASRWKKIVRFGGWKLLEECRWETAKRRERGLNLKFFGHVSDRFRILFRVFQTIFRIDLSSFRGQFLSADVQPNKMCRLTHEMFCHTICDHWWCHYWWAPLNSAMPMQLYTILRMCRLCLLATRSSGEVLLVAGQIVTHVPPMVRNGSSYNVYFQAHMSPAIPTPELCTCFAVSCPIIAGKSEGRNNRSSDQGATLESLCSHVLHRKPQEDPVDHVHVMSTDQGWALFTFRNQFWRKICVKSCSMNPTANCIKTCNWIAHDCWHVRRQWQSWEILRWFEEVLGPTRRGNNIFDLIEFDWVRRQLNAVNWNWMGVDCVWTWALVICRGSWS